MANGLVILVFLLVFVAVTSASVFSSDSQILSMIKELQEKATAQEKAIRSLQALTAKQDSVISSLQNRIAKQDHKISSLKKQGKRQNNLINTLLKKWQLHNEPVSNTSDFNMAMIGKLTDEIQPQKGQIAERRGPIDMVWDQGQQSEQQGPRRPKRRSMIGAQPVAFQAVVSADSVSHIGLHQKIVFDSVHLNVGGNYHNFNGVFIAPRAGIYLFSTSVLSESNGSIDVNIIRNGNRIGGAYAEANDSTYSNQGSVTVTVQLDAGDEVWVENRWPADPKLDGHGSHTSFTGVLVMAV